MTKFLIVDDHPIVREGLALVIGHEADFEVCGEAETAPQALEVFDATEPDFVIVDITLKVGNGLDLIREFRSRRPGVPVLVFSMHDEGLYAERALRAGAKGYLMKGKSLATVISTIRKILEGQISLSEPMSARLLNQIVTGTKSQGVSSIERLTDRELEVFQMLGAGIGTREISNRLHLSIKTVEGYNEQIKQKLGLKTSNELIRRAVVWVESEMPN